MAHKKIIFMGTPEFAVPALKALLASPHDVVAVYSQPPRPAGRGKKLRPSPVHQAALDAGVTVETPLNFKTEPDRARFLAWGADLAVVAAYGLILPPLILSGPRLGCVNIHASLLPRWRGAAPIHRAIEAGDAETGICLMQMEKGLDTGPVLAQSRTNIGNEETTGLLHDRLAAMGADLLTAHLDALLDGQLDGVQQSTVGVTYAHKIEKAEAEIDWSKPADQVARHILAMAPFPGAFSHLLGDRIKILDARVYHESRPAAAPEGYKPGTLITQTGCVACGDGMLQITRLQRGGKPAADIDAYLRGNSLPQGQLFERHTSQTPARDQA